MDLCMEKRVESATLMATPRNANVRCESVFLTWRIEVASSKRLIKVH